MINLETFMLGLLIVSTLTSLATEAMKKLLTEWKMDYHANTLAGIMSILISGAVGIAYILMNGIEPTPTVSIYFIILVFMSWLCAMVGYDKVVQAISQYKTNEKEG